MAIDIERHARRQARASSTTTSPSRSGRRRGRRSSSFSIARPTRKYQHFPRPVSIFTGRRRDIEWREVSGKGKVFSYTIAHRGTPAFRGTEPYAVASVTLDVGVNVIANMVNCTAEDLKVGMKVKPYWHPLDDGDAPADVPARQGRGMSGPEDARGPKAVARFLRPRSVAIVGMSTRAGSAGQVILQSLKLNKFQGDIHLVGRSDEPIDGRPVLKSAGRTAGGRRPCGVHAAGGRRARGHRGLREAQGRLGHGVRRGLCRDRRQRDAGRGRQHRARRRARHRRAQLPRRHQQRRRHDAAHAVRARGAAFGEIEAGVAFVGQSGGMLGHFQRATDGARHAARPM